VVLVEARTFPKISAQLFFRSGNASVAHTTPGLAEMTASVARTGTATRPLRRIEEDLRRMGADLAAVAGADSSAIGISGVAEFSEGLLEMLADLARNASFPEEEFERERRQRIEGLRIQRTTPDFLATERLRRVLFGKHPYAIVAPKEEQVAAYRRNQLEEFYRQNYAPANALLILVGDFSSEPMLAQVEKIFGAWKAPAPAQQKSPGPPRHSLLVKHKRPRSRYRLVNIRTFRGSYRACSQIRALCYL